MVIDDVDTITNELEEDEHPSTFDNQIVDKTDAKFTGEEPAMKQYFYPLSLYQCKNMTINKCHLELNKEGKVMPYEGVGTALQNHSKIDICNGTDDRQRYCYICKRTIIMALR